MTPRLVRSITALSSVLVIAAAGVALQPAGGPGGGGEKSPAQPAGQPGERAPGGQGGPGGRQQSVGGAMRSMDRAMNQLAKQIGDAAKKAENLRLINDIQRACVNAKGAPIPEEVLKKAPDEAAKTKLTDEFRRELIKSLRLLLDIETDIADGKNDAAKTKLEELEKLRDHAHGEMGL